MSTFSTVFGFDPEATASAPGRVNLLGEHTDYNDGFVLPTTIPQQTAVAIAVSHNGLFEFHSVQLSAPVRFADGDSPPAGFAQYLHGCVAVAREAGHTVPPLSIAVDSTVPIGAGLSSSAALEVALLRALRARFAWQLSDRTLALMAQQAEVRYAGVRCGIMDQMACSVGSADHMLFLDARSLESELLPLPPNAAVMVVDSGVQRTLAASGYNTRRRECEAAAELLGLKSLRELQSLPATNRLPAPLDRRVRHVFTENARVLAGTRSQDPHRFGALMNESHWSLRDDFEVSVPPLDALVALLQEQPGVYGARLTGAGFGGACVALVRPDARAAAERDVLARGAQQGLSCRLLV